MYYTTSALDESHASQLQIDFRIGKLSAIHGAKFCAGQRSACVALNRLRARGILEAAKVPITGKQISPHVWAAALSRRAHEWQLPLIPLEQLGILHDEYGLPTSSFLQPLPSGAEAYPYFDRDNEVVYKLFNLRGDGSLGKKLSLELNAEGEFELCSLSATLEDTVEKLILLNEIGAHPTEIVGLSDDGDYLISKQPLARSHLDFHVDRETAIKLIKGVVPSATGLNTTVSVIWLADQTWLVGDLHERNIMRDGDDQPTIIDALVGPVPPLALKHLAWLRNASEDAQALRENRPPPVRRAFDAVEDSEL